MVEAIRKLVSGNRRRFHDDNFSLDLTYIIPNRLIAMSYPSSGFESLYRNSIDKVSHQLHWHLSLAPIWIFRNSAPSACSQSTLMTMHLCLTLSLY